MHIQNSNKSYNETINLTIGLIFMQFQTSMLPTGAREITTFEELAVWAGQALAIANPTAKFVRTVGQTSEPVASFGETPTADNDYRLQIVVIPLLDLTKVGQSLPDWKKVIEISTTPVLTSFTG